jgi:hypothetical protein
MIWRSEIIDKCDGRNNKGNANELGMGYLQRNSEGPDNGICWAMSMGIWEFGNDDECMERNGQIR